MFAMDKAYLQTFVSSRLHTPHPCLFPVKIAQSPSHSPHSRHLTMIRYSSKDEDPKLVNQPGVSTYRRATERSDMPLSSLAPGTSKWRLTSASEPFLTITEEVVRLSRSWTVLQMPIESVDRTCYFLGGNRVAIKNLEVYYKAGAADIADVETAFQGFENECILLHRLIEHAKQATGQQLLIESGKSVLNKMVRTFMNGDNDEPLSPLNALAISSRRFRYPFNASLDFIRNSEFTDKAGLEMFLAEHPDLEDALNMLVNLSVGDFSAIAPFTVGTCEYDNVTMDMLQRALDDAFPANECGDDVRQPLKTVLKCLQDLSNRLNENLFV